MCVCVCGGVQRAGREQQCPSSGSSSPSRGPRVTHQGGDPLAMALARAQRLARGRVPQPDVAIHVSTRNHRPVRGPGNTEHPVFVALQGMHARRRAACISITSSAPRLGVAGLGCCWPLCCSPPRAPPCTPLSTAALLHCQRPTHQPPPPAPTQANPPTRPAHLALPLRQLRVEVPEAQRGVARPRGQLLAVRAEGHHQHSLCVPRHRRGAAAHRAHPEHGLREVHHAQRLLHRHDMLGQVCAQFAAQLLRWCVCVCLVDGVFG